MFSFLSVSFMSFCFSPLCYLNGFYGKNIKCAAMWGRWFSQFTGRATRKLHLLVNQGFPSSLSKLCFLLWDNFLHSEHAPLPQGDVKWYVQRHIMGPFTSSGKCNHDKSLEVHTVEAFANREDIAQRGGLLALPAPPAPALKGHVSLTVHWTLYGIHRSCVLQSSVSCTSGQTHTVFQSIQWSTMAPYMIVALPFLRILQLHFPGCQ